MMRKNQKPEGIASLLSKTLKGLNLESKLKRHSVWSHWDKIVGKTIAEKAWPSRLMEDTLVVKVINASWMNELSFMKQQILEKIQTEIPDCPIKHLRLELGTKKFFIPD
ncbi:MAG: DUF721 domain-containing protein [Deltaproteobacteria bacterium]|nr:DUF721 domain-containing protein [Deltaproteobacteria bacterium]